MQFLYFLSDNIYTKKVMSTRYLVEIKQSLIDGKGLFANSRIPARRKIGELEGERVSVRTARRRAKNYERIAIVEIGDGTAIDASIRETEFKYINHSCSPNSYMRTCYGRVEFYSLRVIKKGEEITCDYGITHHDGTKPCECGSKLCRKYI
jgi:uncharacterized protein